MKNSENFEIEKFSKISIQNCMKMRNFEIEKKCPEKKVPDRRLFRRYLREVCELWVGTGSVVKVTTSTFQRTAARLQSRSRKI